MSDSDFGAFLVGVVVGAVATALVVTEGGRQVAVATGRRLAYTAKTVQEAYIEKVSP